MGNFQGLSVLRTILFSLVKGNLSTTIFILTYFSFLLYYSQAPLLIGCDVSNTTKETMEIIANKEVIDVNQGNQIHQLLCS